MRCFFLGVEAVMMEDRECDAGGDELDTFEVLKTTSATLIKLDEFKSKFYNITKCTGNYLLFLTL